MRKLWGLVVLALLAVPLGAARGGEATAEASLQLLEERRRSERVVDLIFETDALDAPTPVRVFLPEGYDPADATRYPVVYLLHGAR